MAEDPGSRVNLERARAEYEKFREATRARPEKGKVTIRAVARIVEDAHLEGTVRGHRFEADEPPERGGQNRAPAPLSYFLMGAAF
jgi:hypothetical protein